MFRSLYWRIGVGVLAALGAFGLGARGINWPNADFWKSRQRLALVALLAVSFAAINGLFEAGRNYRREQTEELELKIQQPLRALFVNLLDEMGPNHYKDLGVHCFLVRRRWRLRFPWIYSELVRVGEFQLKIRPHAGVHWTKGKGLIGNCWAQNQDVGVNLSEDWRDLRTLSPGDWDSLDSEVRYGLSYKEYQRTSDYEAIVATPIQGTGGDFRGCISVDSTEPTYDALWDSRVRENMQNCAQAVARQAKLS